ncbi:MAG: hypothetical protein ACHQ0J_05105 [Candidatus Dormibacterales bacterium]
MESLERRAGGTILDRERATYQLSIRGMSQREWAKRAGKTEAQVCHALAGRPVNPRTLRKLVEALVAAPVLPGAELIVAAPSNGAGKKNAEGAQASAKEVSRRAGATPKGV